MFTDQNLILCIQYHSFTRIWVRIVFLFNLFKASFLCLQGQWPFFTVTTVDACLCHGIYWFPHFPQVWPLLWISVTVGNSIPSLRIFTIWRVEGWQRSMWKPPQMSIQNGPLFIIYSSSPRGGSRWGVFHKCSDINTPPPPHPPPHIGGC